MMSKLALLLVAAAGGALLSSAPAVAAVCTGNCGTLGANGVVTLSPAGSDTYQFVSTFLGQNGAGQLPGAVGTNGSELVSDPFFAEAGTVVEFYFNYVTSDGSGFADYAFSQLRTAGNVTVANIFTARTKPSGTIVPGTDLPAVTADLTPASVPIIAGGPAWSPLGDSSGECFDDGCGYTGWIRSRYTVTADGSYTLAFGVTNFDDLAFDSGLAFDGLLVGGAVLGDGSSADQPLLPADIGPDGSFEFIFEATPGEVVFVDPLVAVGYDFEVAAGSPLIVSALFPIIPGDADGYDIYRLGESTNPLFTDVLGGTTIDFTSLLEFANGISGFTILDIDPGAGLDPEDPLAFVTGLGFASAGTVELSQTPITLDVPGGVPEPSVWAMLLGGFGFVGGAMRRRARAVA